MEARPGVRAEADHVAGIGRYFRLVQDDVQHRVLAAVRQMRQSEFLVQRGFPRDGPGRRIFRFFQPSFKVMIIKENFVFEANSNS